MTEEKLKAKKKWKIHTSQNVAQDMSKGLKHILNINGKQTNILPDMHIIE
jgi:hypothetical protein